MKLGSTAVRIVIPRLFLFSMVIAAVALASAQNTAQSTAKLAAAAGDIPAASQIQAADLAQAMKSAQKPVVLYVGPKTFFAQAHIPGSENIGPVSKPEGMSKLQARVASLPKDSAMVIYCGCCPWDHCPNIRPAFAELKKQGFTNVRVLYLATSFGADWKDKGLPVATGE
jgi:rhodanese-related sulfurtransferase